MAETTGSIALLGAAGLTGRPLAMALERRGVPVRAVVRRPEQQAGFRDARIADLASADQLAAAFEGARAIHYVPPSFNEREPAFAATIMAAAQRAGVSRLVYHSVLHAPTPAMPHHARKAEVELMLRESDLVWTILQPAMYTQTCLTFLDKEARRFTPPYSLDRLFNPVDLADLTEATATVVAEAGHEYATYELAGAERLTPAAMAEVIRATLGDDVALEQEEMEVFARARARRRNFDAAQTAELIAMYRHYGDFGLPGNGHVLEMLLGRPSTTFAAVLRRDHAASWPGPGRMGTNSTSRGA